MGDEVSGAGRVSLGDLAAGPVRRRLAPDAEARAADDDRSGRFPFATFRDLHQAGYLALTVPQELGGCGANVLEVALAQERLARGDGSVALAATMHRT